MASESSSSNTLTTPDVDGLTTPLEGGKHTTPLDGDSSHGTSSERVQIGTKRKYSDLVDLVDKELNDNTWSLPEDLANHFNRQAKNYIPPKRLQEHIMDVHPVPPTLSNDRRWMTFW